MAQSTYKNDVTVETTPLLDNDDEQAPDNQKLTSKQIWILPALAIGCFLSAADQTIVFASYGEIGNELNALTKTSWLATAYLLPLSSLQVLYGKLSDIFGRRNLLIFAFVTFGIGCLLCGLAQTMDQLIIARAISGMGGGGFNTLATIVLADQTPLRQRGTFQGYRDLVFALGLGAGSLGGFITESIGWRWSFLLQIPFVLAGLANIFLCFDNDYSAKEGGWKSKVKRIDFAGAILIILAVSSLLVGLEQAPYGIWKSPLTLSCLGASLILSIAFFYVEMRIAAEPFAPRHVLFSRHVGAAIALNFFIYGCWFSILYQLPLYWQAVEGISPSTTALRLLPGFVAGVFGSLFAGDMIQVYGRYSWLTIIVTGGINVALVVIMLCAGWVTQSTVGVMIGLGFCGFFLNAAAIGSLVALMAHSEPEDLATAISCRHLFACLGSSICLGISAATVQNVLRSQLRARVDSRGPEGLHEIIQRITESLNNIGELNSATQVIVRESYEVAVQWSLLVCMCFAVMAFLSSLVIREKKHTALQ